MTAHFPFLVVLSLPIVGVAVPAHAEYLYTYTELIPFANTLVGYGGDYPFDTFASAINNQGQIVGSSTTEGRRYTSSALWEDSTISAIPGTLATTISNTSEVAGYAAYRTQTVPFSWDGTTQASLSTNNNNYAYAYGINDSGQVVGDMLLSDIGRTHATLWNGSVATDLGTLGAPYSNSSARAINASGQVVGWSGLTNSSANDNSNVHATVWNGTTITDLGALGVGSSLANDINDSNQVVGTSSGRATLWDGAAITDLGTLESYSNSDAIAINNLGQVVGMSYSTWSDRHMTLWDGTAIIDLNTFVTPSFIEPGWNFQVSDINDNGWIIGNATDSNWHTRAFLLTPMTPVPEPQTYGMFLAGIGLLGFLRQRKKHCIRRF